MSGTTPSSSTPLEKALSNLADRVQALETALRHAEGDVAVITVSSYQPVSLVDPAGVEMFRGYVHEIAMTVDPMESTASVSLRPLY